MRKNRGNPLLILFCLGGFCIYNLKRYAMITASSIIFAIVLTIFAYIAKYLLIKLKYNNAQISYILQRIIIAPFLVALIIYIVFGLFQLYDSKDVSVLPKIILDCIFISLITYTIFTMIFEVFLNLDISLGSIWNQPQSLPIKDNKRSITTILLIISIIFCFLFFPLMPLFLLSIFYLKEFKKTGYKIFYIPPVLIISLTTIGVAFLLFGYKTKLLENF